MLRFRSFALAFIGLAVGATLASAQVRSNWILGTLSANPYATPAPVVPYVPPVRPYVTVPRMSVPARPALPMIGGPKVVARDGQYLGRLNDNKFDPDSVSNTYGRYGNPYSPDSINNDFGKYGNPYSPYSATNPYATQPPLLIGW